MGRKVIITVAPTGSIPTRKDNPHLPITAEEVAEETRRAYEAGASVVHLHARNPDTGEPTSDPAVFRDDPFGHPGGLSHHNPDHDRRRRYHPGTHALKID